MTFIQFCTQYELIVPSRRLDDYRPIALRPNQLLTHTMFGESRLAFTDGIHAFVLFLDGVREVHHSNLGIRSPGVEGSSPVPKEAAKPRVKKNPWGDQFCNF